MLASYLAKQYAMYALANQYQQQSGNLVIPSVCFQSTARIDHPAIRTIASGVNTSNQSGHSSGLVIPLETTKRPKIKQTSQNSKDMSSEIKFSIDRILAKSDSDDSSKDIGEDVDETGDTHATAESLDMAHFAMDEEMKFSWLNCTRYKPPKLQRMRKKDGGKKRKLGRNPRVPFSQHQVAALEQKFCRTHYLSSMDVAELSTALNLTETRVKIWFQNRRARERRDRDAKRRLGIEFDQGSMSNSLVTYTSTSSAPTVSWRNIRADTTDTYQA